MDIILKLSLGLLFCATHCVSAFNYPSHRGNSPIDFDEIKAPSDTFIVNDTDSPTLDKYTFRGNGEFDIGIPINVRRYIGDLVLLKHNGLISETAKIYIPAFDIDDSFNPTFDCDGDDIPETFEPEKNEVYFNGELIGILSGDNQLWQFNRSFEVPIELVKFPSAPGETGENHITIKVDVANKDIPLSGGGVGCQVWATEIDWAAIDFEVSAPVGMASGLFGSPDSFITSGYKETILNELGLPSEIFPHSLLDITIQKCYSTVSPSLDIHASEMRETIRQYAESYGTSSFHIIAHSKGGLDTKAFLRDIKKEPLKVRIGKMGDIPVYSDLSIDSYISHGTPHNGSAFADYLVAKLTLSSFYDVPIWGLNASDLCDLTTHSMGNINPNLYISSSVKSLMIGADADLNNSFEIDEFEAIGNQVPYLSGVPLPNYLYRMLLFNRSFEVIWVDLPVIGKVAWDIKPEIARDLWNDTQVTIDSALAAFGGQFKVSLVDAEGKNHGTILDRDVQMKVIEQALTNLEWRVN
ncbi:esterase/lipase family protein [Pseudoalteromonas sp. GB56]